jgi:aminopeptidase-like protein
LNATPALSGPVLANLERREGALRLAESALGLLAEIYPIARSITGDGVRETLDLLGQHAPLVRFEIPSGTPVFDWKVPLEWNVREAHICNANGERVVDFRRHALHILGYSTPVRSRLSLAELLPHLHSLPDHPEVIPYRTSYWREDWGFCLTQRQLDALPDGEYDVLIDSTLVPGSLTYAECRITGEIADEFLVFTHTCHPALANDNASGMAVATLLAAELSRARPRLSYRFVFAPATIGSITWLALNSAAAQALRGGLVVGLLGDAGPLTYKRSRRGNAEIDFIAANIVRCLDPSARVVDFSPYGYDERQFCSPGFDLPVGRLTRSPNGEYPEYHTSADNPELMSKDAIANSVQALARIINRVDGNGRLRRVEPHCEPRLGRHNLFRDTGGSGPREFEYALLWLLNLADGSHGPRDIADAARLPDSVIQYGLEALLDAGLIEEVDQGRLA